MKANSQVFDYNQEMMMKNPYPLLTTPPMQGQFAGIHNNGIFMSKTPNSKNLILSEYDEINSDNNLDQLHDIQNRLQLATSEEKRKPIILDEGKQIYCGRLKFFDENKNYGFIIMDEDGSDIFVHYDDLQKAGINKEILKSTRLGQVIKLAFSCMKYIGKYDKSRKATDIQILG